MCFQSVSIQSRIPTSNKPAAMNLSEIISSPTVNNDITALLSGAEKLHSSRQPSATKQNSRAARQ